MKQPSSDRFARGIFTASLALIALVYGVVSSWWGWFPAPQLGEAHRTFLDVKQNWRNDIGLEPTRHLVAPNGPGTTDPDRGYERRPGTERAPGYILIAGLSDDQDTSVFAVRLMDTSGNEVHRWPIYYENFDPDTPPQNVMLHGMEVFEDGSVVVTFDVGNAIARVDQCGETMWSVRGGFHHSITRDGSGGIWTWLGEDMVRLDAATGEQTFALNLRNDVIAANNGEQRAIFDIRVRMPDDADSSITYLDDPFHPNDVEMLRPALADAFPMFEPGDLMFSLREPNLVAVVDPQTGLLKWWQHGPWFKQHDPDFEPDGTITVFDNATGATRSRILRIDPNDRRISVDFAGTEAEPFYTWRRGKHQTLPNGNLLLTEAEHGRLLEVSAEGDVVWTHHMVWDADSNLIVTEARHVPEAFFTNGTPTCATELAER
ncbi:arylsulfotransferase family protein [Roseobacter sinensis]|uniref:Arylsulfotransferase family protein n=1 Tax=Roseobacter sinensis TaxID=2931391 RepID=A0ABT3BJ67_9RHOB|nr:arylsulfotransferase family protein [Roseobacter sp. WL0113]MCV3273626.1 arylsulfotransferase family protein [Roseobacter sp. WL0113]